MIATCLIIMALKRKTVKKKVATCVKILVQKLFEIKKHYKLHSFITDFNRKYFLSGVATCGKFLF